MQSSVTSTASFAITSATPLLPGIVRMNIAITSPITWFRVEGSGHRYLAEAAAAPSFLQPMPCPPKAGKSGAEALDPKPWVQSVCRLNEMLLQLWSKCGASRVLFRKYRTSNPPQRPQKNIAILFTVISCVHPGV